MNPTNQIDKIHRKIYIVYEFLWVHSETRETFQDKKREGEGKTKRKEQAKEKVWSTSKFYILELLDFIVNAMLLNLFYVKRF